MGISSTVSRLLAAFFAAALLAVSFWRTHAAHVDERESSIAPITPIVAPPASASSGSADPGAASRSPTSTPAGAVLRLDLQAAIASGAAGPPLTLRVRPRDGATRPFDLTVKEEHPRQHFTIAAALPVQAVELPLRVELIGDDWCIPPGLTTLSIARLDPPLRVVLERARRCERIVLAEEGATPIAGVAIVHADGAVLATSGASGALTFLRPERAAGSSSDLLFALAPGWLPTWIDESSRAPIVLRSVARAGSLAGTVVDADGKPLAGARIVPHFDPAGELPVDPAPRDLVRALLATKEADIVALSVKSGAYGTFELPLAWPGKLLLRASTRELRSTTLALDSLEGMTDGGRRTAFEIRFPARFDLRVTVTRFGVASSDVSVEAVTRDGDHPRTIEASVTDRTGELTLHLPAITPLWLVVRAAYEAPQVREVVPAMGAAPIDVELRPSRTVVFTVAGTAGEDGKPRSIPLVVQVVDAASRVLLAEKTVDAKGGVRLVGMPVGRALALLIGEPGSEGQLLRELTLTAETAADAQGAAAAIDLGTLAMPGVGQ